MVCDGGIYVMCNRCQGCDDAWAVGKLGEVMLYAHHTILYVYRACKTHTKVMMLSLLTGKCHML